MTEANPQSILILGGEGMGLIAASVAQSLGLHVLGFLNDIAEVGSTIGRKVPFPVLGASSDWEQFDDGTVKFIVTFGAMQRSERALRHINSLGLRPNVLGSLISPTAHLDLDFITLGQGVLVASGSGVSVDASIGNHSALMTGSYLGHDSSIADFVHLAAGAVVGAYCTIGDGVHVGTNATVRERVKIGAYSLIGSGSVILNDVPSRSIVVGNPGRIIRTLPEA